MGAFVAEVRPRWSDMDMYGHVNHARTVTLLEEARGDMLFREAAAYGTEDLAKGLVVARLDVQYKAPLFAFGTTLRVEISVREIRSAYFVLDYRVRSGPTEDDPVAVTASTTLAPFDFVAQKPRRISQGEREFLSTWHNTVPEDGNNSA
ncbi:1,4-dihydroxy-2-naphthoyl-CoA hydrolase in phylloquinone biosynthesis [Actinokineospora spheciospongiae]|uniref:1,4-dihydroxy-2-naphthoyl-CoA hydrolase in phylloquinone biosynthesis n=2 Tax=Actinokineospora spheciospongiae TaxID=909613 RepID=W7IVJ1_9PSEU|nr:1,4-dihydroxy-2-naphthoyl-CoA hydrolase in phylloquinone biosynthesis [Actinokineospora spheciospongiae]PWW56204.1 acyl-CoA thioester hydrolase [Actinokineospora spheciospongiae]